MTNPPAATPLTEATETAERTALPIDASALAAWLHGRLEGELRLGSGFRPERVRADRNAALVMGDGGLVWVDLSTPARPRALSRLGPDEVGAKTRTDRHRGDER